MVFFISRQLIMKRCLDVPMPRKTGAKRKLNYNSLTVEM